MNLALHQINASSDQRLFELVRIETTELLLANEYQGNSFATLALKLSKSPAVALDILFAEAYSLLA